MSFVQRLSRATLPVRRKADKDTVDAVETLMKWAEIHPGKHQNGETVRLVNRALLLDDGDAVTRAYMGISRMREFERGNAAFLGMVEFLQDKLLDRLDKHTKDRQFS
jgi:hypothetical protein